MSKDFYLVKNPKNFIDFSKTKKEEKKKKKKIFVPNVVQKWFYQELDKDGDLILFINVQIVNLLIINIQKDLEVKK